MDDVKIGIGDTVVEKHGKINRDYTLLNPPLGKGKLIYAINNNKYKTAYFSEKFSYYPPYDY